MGDLTLEAGEKMERERNSGSGAGGPEGNEGNEGNDGNEGNEGGECLQPLDGLDVDVVGRLIQQQQVRLLCVRSSVVRRAPI